LENAGIDYTVNGIDYCGMYACLALGLLTDEEVLSLPTEYGNNDTAYCTKCKQEKQITEFYRNKQKWMGVNCNCKTCDLQHQRTPHRKKELLLSRARRISRRVKAEATLTQTEWEMVLQHYDNRCAYCGRSSDEVGSLAKEHVYPLSRGGGLTVLNIVPSCRSCNSTKNARTPAEAGLTLKRIPLAQLDLFDNE